LYLNLVKVGWTECQRISGRRRDARLEHIKRQAFVTDGQNGPPKNVVARLLTDKTGRDVSQSIGDLHYRTATPLPQKESALIG
jgi:hypothetical protein